MVRAGVFLVSAILAIVNGVLSYTALVDGRRDFAAIAAVAALIFLALTVELAFQWGSEVKSQHFLAVLWLVLSLASVAGFVAFSFMDATGPAFVAYVLSLYTAATALRNLRAARKDYE